MCDQMGIGCGLILLTYKIKTGDTNYPQSRNLGVKIGKEHVRGASTVGAFVLLSCALNAPVVWEMCVLGTFLALIPVCPHSEGYTMIHVLQLRNRQKISNLLKVAMVREWQNQEIWLSSGPGFLLRMLRMFWWKSLLSGFPWRAESPRGCRTSVSFEVRLELHLLDECHCRAVT